jgi:hypothetical protein
MFAAGGPVGFQAPWLIAMAGLVAIAIGVFIQVQAHINDPQRHRLNEEWFTSFNEHQRQRYQQRELSWRVTALTGHFSNESRHH